jgi:hypothetical protein
LPHAIDVRAICDSILVTYPADFRGKGSKEARSKVVGVYSRSGSVHFFPDSGLQRNALNNLGADNTQALL